jgi:hypothetical protein
MHTHIKEIKDIGTYCMASALTRVTHNVGKEQLREREMKDLGAQRNKGIVITPKVLRFALISLSLRIVLAVT